MNLISIIGVSSITSTVTLVACKSDAKRTCQCQTDDTYYRGLLTPVQLVKHSRQASKTQALPITSGKDCEDVIMGYKTSYYFHLQPLQ